MITAAEIFITNVHVSIDLEHEPGWGDILPDHFIRTAANFIVQTAAVPAQCGNPAHNVFTFDDNSAFVMIRDSDHLYRIANADELDSENPYSPEHSAWLTIGDQTRAPTVRSLLRDIAD